MVSVGVTELFPEIRNGYRQGEGIEEIYQATRDALSALNMDMVQAEDKVNIPRSEHGFYILEGLHYREMLKAIGDAVRQKTGCRNIRYRVASGVGVREADEVVDTPNGPEGELAMSGRKNRQFILAEIPKGKLGQEHFRLQESDVPRPAEGEVLVKVRYISIDPANRAWMQGATYRAAVIAGDIMAGYALGEVVESRYPKLKQGDLVFGDCGWQEYALRPGMALNRLPVLEPITHLLSVYGITGLTAYFGLLEIGTPRTGETLVVSAAAGATGSVAGQIGKIKGCRVVGIAGSDDKCAWVTGELGFDASINYKKGNVHEALRQVCPKGIDIYFDNVGGDILEAVLFQTNPHGRIICCGTVSGYDGVLPTKGPRGIPGLLVINRILMRGFIVMDFLEKYTQAWKQLTEWVAAGRIKVREDIVEGFENTPTALIGLLHGENYGKRLVKVS